MTKLKHSFLDADLGEAPASNELTVVKKPTELDVIKPHRVLRKLHQPADSKLRKDLNLIFLTNSPSSYYLPAPISVSNKVNFSLLSSSKRVLQFDPNQTKLRRVIDLSPYLSLKQAKLER